MGKSGKHCHGSGGQEGGEQWVVREYKYTNSVSVGIVVLSTRDVVSTDTSLYGLPSARIRIHHWQVVVDVWLQTGVLCALGYMSPTDYVVHIKSCIPPI